MMGYFPDCFTKEQFGENRKRYNTQTIYEDEERGLFMTRQEASAYDDTLKKVLKQAALKHGLKETLGDYIVDNYIEMQPEPPVKEMNFQGERAVSYKLGDIRIDIKKALVAGVELTAPVSRPESIYYYIQLLIIAVLFVAKSTRQEASELETYIIYLLHRKGAYRSIEEEAFICEMQEWYQEKKGNKLSRGEIVEAINHLYEMQIADFENGNIYLKECVWGRAR